MVTGVIGEKLELPLVISLLCFSACSLTTAATAGNKGSSSDGQQTLYITLSVALIAVVLVLLAAAIGVVSVNVSDLDLGHVFFPSDCELMTLSELGMVCSSPATFRIPVKSLTSKACQQQDFVWRKSHLSTELSLVRVMCGGPQK